MRLRALLLAALALVLSLPAPGHAHLQLESAAPAPGAQLSEAPGEIRLTFSQPVELALSRVTLMGPQGEVALGDPALPPGSGRTLVAPVVGPLARGTYRVVWQTAGPDGHPIRGEYSFSIEPGARGVTPQPVPDGSTAPGQAAPPAEPREAVSGATRDRFGAESPLYVSVRWLTFVGLLGAIGVVAFRLFVLWMVRRQEGVDAEGFIARAARRSAELGIAVTVLLVAALLLRLYAQSAALHGVEDAWSPEGISALLTRTVWGWGWWLQAVGTGVALVGFLLARRDSAVGWGAALLGVLALAFAPALSGHAVAMPELTALAVLTDGLHVLGAGGWLGSLLVVVAVGLPLALRLERGLRGRTVAFLINAFSPTALFFAGVVVATGVLSAWLHLGSVPALWESAYGRTLLVKLAVLSVVFGTGAYNWLRVKPSLGDEKAASRLRRSAALELAVGVLVLAVTAVLVATPPPTEAPEPGESPRASARAPTR